MEEKKNKIRVCGVEFDTFIHNIYALGVYMHLTGKNPYKGNFNICTLAGMALYKTMNLNEQLKNPEKLWSFACDFANSYSEYYLDIEQKCEDDIDNKLIDMFAQKVRRILEKEE